MKKAKRKENWMFNVPNDEEGAYFTHLFNKYLNKDSYEVRRRPRGKRTVHAKKDGHHPRSYDAYLPVRHADRFQVYMTKKPDNLPLEERTDFSGRTKKAFLEDTFRHNHCDECGGGMDDHVALAISVTNARLEYCHKWVAYCKDGGATFRPSYAHEKAYENGAEDSKSRRWGGRD